MASIIKRSGRYNYRIKEHTGEKCVIDFLENGEHVGVSSFTIEEAKAAGLAGKSVWKSYPRNMLFARALSNGARWHCPDLFLGPIYTAEELSGGGRRDEDETIVEDAVKAATVTEETATAIVDAEFEDVAPVAAEAPAVEEPTPAPAPEPEPELEPVTPPPPAEVPAPAQKPTTKGLLFARKYIELVQACAREEDIWALIERNRAKLRALDKTTQDGLEAFESLALVRVTGGGDETPEEIAALQGKADALFALVNPNTAGETSAAAQVSP